MKTTKCENVKIERFFFEKYQKAVTGERRRVVRRPSLFPVFSRRRLFPSSPAAAAAALDRDERGEVRCVVGEQQRRAVRGDRDARQVDAGEGDRGERRAGGVAQHRRRDDDDGAAQDVREREHVRLLEALVDGRVALAARRHAAEGRGGGDA